MAAALAAVHLAMATKNVAAAINSGDHQVADRREVGAVRHLHSTAIWTTTFRFELSPSWDDISYNRLCEER